MPPPPPHLANLSPDEVNSVNSKFNSFYFLNFDGESGRDDEDKEAVTLLVV